MTCEGESGESWSAPTGVDGFILDSGQARLPLIARQSWFCSLSATALIFRGTPIITGERAGGHPILRLASDLSALEQLPVQVDRLRGNRCPGKCLFRAFPPRLAELSRFCRIVE